jgi:anthranilate synthase component 1
LTPFDDFRALAARSSFVPVVRETLADVLTPVSAFLRIASDTRRAFLLESAEAGERMGRYSFLGRDPFLVLRAVEGGGRTTLERNGVVEESPELFMPTLRRLMAEYHAPVLPNLPSFTGGAVGFVGYDAAPWFEPALEASFAAKAAGHAKTLPAAFMFFDTVLAFDHLRRRLLIIAHVPVGPGHDLATQYAAACDRIAAVERDLDAPRSSAVAAAASPAGPVRSNVERARFEQSVRDAQEHIAAGDIYQVVLSQRFSVDTDVDPFAVYRALRYVNPSPYMFFVRLDDTTLVGASPEMLVRVEGRHAETYPIAGTRPRGASEAEDDALAAQLLADEKERAEHVMLVDLGRNDLGRICEYGSVRVTHFMDVERYSHVMHLVSRVEGRLAHGRDRFDALASCFPAGTVSGAPKIRAMQIIAELEPDDRGVYAGAVGHLGFAGNLDCCITIRTILCRDHTISVQAGAGIVADSNPAAEYEESCNKARALLSAIALAEKGL